MDLGDIIFVSTPGTILYLEGDALRLVVPDRPGRHLVPLHRADSLVLWHGVSASPDVLQWCVTHGVHVSWITQNGKLMATVTGHEPARGELRLRQFRAHDDSEHRAKLAARMVAGKLQNYRQLLLRAARDATGTRQKKLRRVAEKHSEGLARLGSATELNEVLGIEGNCARHYFSALDLVARDAKNLRTRRPALDPVNAYLSATYALLRSSVHSAVVHTGLDPAIGFLHGTRGGRPALALDLMEEMRALLADRLVATLFNRGQIRSSYWRAVDGGEVLLTDAGWKHLLQEWVASRQRLWPHVPLGRKVPAAEIPVLQARLLARHLREPDFAYVPWMVSK